MVSNASAPFLRVSLMSKAPRRATKLPTITASKSMNNPSANAPLIAPVIGIPLTIRHVSAIARRSTDKLRTVSIEGATLKYDISPRTIASSPTTRPIRANAPIALRLTFSHWPRIRMAVDKERISIDNDTEAAIEDSMGSPAIK